MLSLKQGIIKRFLPPTLYFVLGGNPGQVSEQIYHPTIPFSFSNYVMNVNISQKNTSTAHNVLPHINFKCSAQREIALSIDGVGS